MTLYALTGGIGSGKSTVARRLAELGAVIVDADALAREVLAVGSPGLAAVADRFGADLIDADGALNRAELASRVFGDPTALADLNAITHPLIAARSAEEFARIPAEKVAIYDVALLVEGGLGGRFDGVIVVEATPEVREQRLVGRGLDAADARARMARQATDEQRRAVATWVIDNSGSLEQLQDAVDAVWSEMGAR
ncbi:MAG: Dephospho-CoA kinase [Frankiales bacterium]|nr:Dephospho-CoA kinase [Frankiales bacterium]